MDRTSFDRLFDMAGRTVVVTGGTRGIGLALAEGYVLAGAQVVVASRKPDACEQAAAHLRGMGGAAIGVPTHLGEVDDLAALGPASVVYVACDPVALARDLSRFAGHGYRTDRVRGIDLFPHSHHMEAVALLRRDAAR